MSKRAAKKIEELNQFLGWLETKGFCLARITEGQGGQTSMYLGNIDTLLTEYLGAKCP